LRRSLAIAQKDFRDILRERTILLALVLQLFIAAFSSFLLVGLVSLYNPDEAEAHTDSRIAYVGPGPFGRYLDDNSSLRVSIVDQQNAKILFDEGNVDAIVEEMYDEPGQVRTVNLLLPEGELQTTLLVTVIKEQLKGYERVLRDAREGSLETTIIYIEAPGVPNPFYAFAYALLVPLLLTVPTFLSGAIAADAVTQEVDTRTIEILRSSPAGSRGIYAGKIIAPIVLAPIQGLLWILLFRLNRIQIVHPIPMLILITAITTIVVCAAVLFALALRKQGDAQIAYSLFVLVILGLAQLLPQPVLTALARLAVGSLTLLEWSTVLGAVGIAVMVFALGRYLAPKLVQRLQ
jgi:ABC-2 type transport system permease protein